MLAIILMMSLGVLIATAVAIYVAFPHRGEQLPVVPQLGDAMRKGVDALPTLEDAESRVLIVRHLESGEPGRFRRTRSGLAHRPPGSRTV